MQDDLAVDTAEVNKETPLFSSGLIDSFSLVNLMAYIEGEGGFMISPTDVNLDNFDTISSILRFAQRVSA